MNYDEAIAEFEKDIIKKKEVLKKYFKSYIDNFNQSDGNLFGHLRIDIFNKFKEFDDYCSGFPEVISGHLASKYKCFFMSKTHSTELYKYIDDAIKAWEENNKQTR